MSKTYIVTEKTANDGLDEMACSALQLCAKRIAGHIQRPMEIYDIVAKIDSDEYNAELMLQHLLLWAAKAERYLKDPHCVRAMALRGEIILPNSHEKTITLPHTTIPVL